MDARLNNSNVSEPTLDTDRMRDIVLVRIATAGKTLIRADLTRELQPLASHIASPTAWSVLLDRDLAALADAGLVTIKPLGVTATEPGLKRAALVLGLPNLPRTWADAKGGRLMVKALGLDSLAARRMKALLKADGLRNAIVLKAFGLKMRTLPSPARIRVELARLALSRAFGNTAPPDVAGRSGLSAKAGRNLAGRLANPPRDFPTDSRLVGALAAEHVGSAKQDLDALQLALLRRYVTKGAIATPAQARPSKGKVATKRQSPRHAPRIAGAIPVTSLDTHLPSVSQSIERSTKPPMGQLSEIVRPDFPGFVIAVRQLADTVADGWSGNRKAFVSRVWRALADRYPGWQLSEIEFKGMLAEAHRVGELLLANADLKDGASIADVQASAIVYKNTIFHYVRVDD
ncbi:MAG: hypothetical protein HOO99_10625 [Hyphomicrobiaceae bacterium]|nr:hypothetical protein [Hyphomicrobiaceae bacterium]